MAGGLAAALGSAWSDPDLPLAVGAVAVAGVVYGFAGFGAALIAIPVLSAVTTPVEAVGALSLTALASLVTVVPGAWGAADRAATGWMLAAAMATLPAGIWVLRAGDPDAIRWLVALVTLGTVAALASGWRRRPGGGRGARLGVGAATGIVGGATGLSGPVVILFQLSGAEPVARTWATIVLFLSFYSLLTLPALWIGGVLTADTATLGAILFGPYLVATWLGQRLFGLASEALYRRVAYVMVACAGIVALPVWP